MKQPTDQPSTAGRDSCDRQKSRICAASSADLSRICTCAPCQPRVHEECASPAKGYAENFVCSDCDLNLWVYYMPPELLRPICTPLVYRSQIGNLRFDLFYFRLFLKEYIWMYVHFSFEHIFLHMLLPWACNFFP
jgi:hypothetical protein